jgi:hypothetical protein
MSRHSMVARVALASGMCLAAEAAIHACPICFQIENGQMAGGVRAAVIVLVSVTSVVVGGCVVFFTRLARRERRS